MKNKFFKLLNIHKCRRNFTKSSEGQSSIEFIIVIPILVIVILIVSQLGFLVYLQNVLEQAAREGARVLATTNSNSLAFEQVINNCSILEKERLAVEITPYSQGARHIGDIVAVNLSYLYGGFAGFIKLITGKEILIKSNCTMRMECGN